mmetsp:Transcript_79639/g.97439  ORF Transcript_79639/g.97439 Transcript_79639/m.97439 type:complete len:199 (+) Transcript_79639:90-686(+)
MNKIVLSLFSIALFVLNVNGMNGLPKSLKDLAAEIDKLVGTMMRQLYQFETEPQHVIRNFEANLNQVATLNEEMRKELDKKKSNHLSDDEMEFYKEFKFFELIEPYCRQLFQDMKTCILEPESDKVDEVKFKKIRVAFAKQWDEVNQQIQQLGQGNDDESGQQHDGLESQDDDESEQPADDDNSRAGDDNSGLSISLG